MDILALSSSSTLIFALVGGIIPPLIWLIFFLHEDLHPEPYRRIALTFVAGMLTVLITIPLQATVKMFFPGGGFSLIMLALWAFIEEGLKYVAAWTTALRTNIFNEPVDALVYLITAALGFAALENALFLIPPLGQELYFQGFTTINLRFIGATLVHVGASGIIGAAVAFSHYRKKLIKEEYLVVGLVGATALHTLFNFFIIESNNTKLFAVFSFVWIIVICLMLFFERAKHIDPPPVDTTQ